MVPQITRVSWPWSFPLFPVILAEKSVLWALTGGMWPACPLSGAESAPPCTATSLPLPNLSLSSPMATPQLLHTLRPSLLPISQSPLRLSRSEKVLGKFPEWPLEQIWQQIPVPRTGEGGAGRKEGCKDRGPCGQADAKTTPPKL